MGEKNRLYYGIFIAVVVVCGICYAFLYAAKAENAVQELSMGGGGAESIETPLPEASATPGPMTFIFVQISGAVRNPGVYELEKDSRVFEAVEMAGGLLESADAAAVNQARIMNDGEMIYFPTTEETESGDYPQQPEESGGLVNINQADQETLMTLPGIGEARAKAIIDYRNQHGPFKSPEEIMNIEGIKEAMYEKIKDSIRI